MSGRGGESHAITETDYYSRAKYLYCCRNKDVATFASTSLLAI